MEEFDFTIIGSGSAGYVAGLRGTQLGLKVCVVEKGDVGGVCLNRGCIPTKAILASVKVARIIQEAENFGLHTGPPKIDFRRVRERKDRIVKKLTSGVAFLLKQSGVEIIRGEAVIKESGYIEVNNKHIKTKSILIATGSKPILPFEIDRVNVIASDEALQLEQPPKSMLIIGGGSIGIEFATIFSGCSTKVTLVEMLPGLLPEVKDEKIVAVLKRKLNQQGIAVIEGTKVKEITVTSEGTVSILSNGDKITTEKVLVATGRVPDSEPFEPLGLKIDNHRIVVDEHMRTSIPGIFAAGDIVGPPLLAHKASREGEVAAENAAGRGTTMDYKAIPNCIFSDPEIACVGKFESEIPGAKIGEYLFQGIGKALCIGEADGFVKVIADQNDIIKGVQIIGPHASDLIALGVLAVQKSLSAAEMGRLVYAHPTLSEVYKEAFLDVNDEAIHKVKKRATDCTD